MYKVKFIAGRDVEAMCNTLADAVLFATQVSKSLGQHYDVTIWSGMKQICLFRAGKEVF